MKFLFWTGYSNNDRHSVINEVKEIIARYGDLVDFKFFSDLSITTTIEIEERNIDSLFHELNTILQLDPFEPLDSNTRKERTIFLNISFTKGSGNLRVEVPAVPG